MAISRAGVSSMKVCSTTSTSFHTLHTTPLGSDRCQRRTDRAAGQEAAKSRPIGSGGHQRPSAVHLPDLRPYSREVSVASARVCLACHQITYQVVATLTATLALNALTTAAEM